MSTNHTENLIRYTQTGTGPCLIFLPGLGLNFHIFDPLITHLKSNFQCISLEFSGNLPKGKKRNCSILSLAKETYALLELNKWQPYAVIGHSLGGFVALRMALLFSQSVPRLVLLSSASHGDPSLIERFLSRHGRISSKKLLRRNMEMCVTDAFSQSEQFEKLYAVQAARSGSGKCFVPLLRGAATFSIDSELSHLLCDTLILAGDDDAIVPTAQTHQLAATITNAQSIVLPGVGHLPQVEAPQQTAAHIQHFLTGKPLN